VTNAFSIATMKLWWRSFLQKTPYIIWSGAINHKDKPDSFLRQLQRKILVRRAAGFIAYGTKAKEYLVSLGVEPDKIEIGINTVETEFFKKEAGKNCNNPEMNKDKKRLLYIGHLSLRKNVMKLLKVIDVLSQRRSDFIFDIVGDGKDRTQLEKYVEKNQLRDFVKFHGFMQKSDISLFMASSDCFLFQTDFDVWGLVLVEAMAAGLPCIASIHAGATHDLIKDGVTGFAMDFSETEKAAKRIGWILDNRESSKKIGQNACCFIEENVNLEKSAERFVKAIIATLMEPACAKY
jgi:glycosyltransferase involved in cell wall biosynthesis